MQDNEELQDEAVDMGCAVYGFSNHNELGDALGEAMAANPFWPVVSPEFQMKCRELPNNVSGYLLTDEDDKIWLAHSAEEVRRLFIER